MVDDDTRVNVMSVATFEKLGYREGELMKTNTSLSAFTGEVTETKGEFSVELMIGSKTLATAFFMVDVKGCYDLLLGRDWIHNNICVPSTLHQCLIQWVGDGIEVVVSEDLVCIATVEPQLGVQEGSVACLSGRDLCGYDYVSVSTDGIVPISMRPTSMTQPDDMTIQ
jgi:hypothetical protein